MFVLWALAWRGIKCDCILRALGEICSQHTESYPEVLETLPGVVCRRRHRRVDLEVLAMRACNIAPVPAGSIRILTLS